MAFTKRAVLIGVGHPDPAAYPGELFGNGGNGCEANVRAMATVLPVRGFKPADIAVLSPQQATRAGVTKVLHEAAAATKAGDFLFVYYTGHASQLAATDGDEADGWDEAMCLYDGRLRDNDLRSVWQAVGAGARVLMLVDACHSGTLFRSITLRSAPTGVMAMARPAGNNPAPAWPWPFSFLYFGASEDPHEATGSLTGTAFSMAFVSLHLPGRPPLSYEALFQLLPRQGPGRGPVMHALGPGSAAMAQGPTFRLDEPA